MKLKNYLLTLPLAFAVSCGPKGNETNVELIQDMMAGPQVKAQEGDTETGRGTVMIPPEHAIPRNRYTPAGAKLKDIEGKKNPLKSITDVELKIKYENAGQEKYQQNCAICHGEKGDGDSPLMRYQSEQKREVLVKNPPSLLTSNYRAYSDARIYYVTTYGWGLMGGGYGSQITDDLERWAVVSYVRELQKMAKKSSANKVKKEVLNAQAR